jgi:hypothetical protein
MGWEPIAVIEGGVIAFVRADHIGRPVFATNSTGVKTCTAGDDPFGGFITTRPTQLRAGRCGGRAVALHASWPKSLRNPERKTLNR